MSGYSTVRVAKQLGISIMTLHRYMRDRKIPAPRVQELAGVRVRVWTDADVERVRKLLPKIANGRKTRYQKKQVEVRNQQSAKQTKQKKQTKKK